MARTNAKDPEQFRVVAEVTRSYQPEHKRTEVYGPYALAKTAKGVAANLRANSEVKVHMARIERNIPSWEIVGVA